MKSVILTATAFATIIFPFFLSGSFFYDKNSARLNFRIALFGVIKLASGYAKLNGKEIFVHLSEKKAFVFDLTKYRPSGNLKNFLSVEVIKFQSETVFPCEIKYLSFATLLKVGECTLLPQKLMIKDFVSVENRLQLRGDRLMIYAHHVVCFNLITVTEILLKSLWSKK